MLQFLFISSIPRINGLYVTANKIIYKELKYKENILLNYLCFFQN